jgi:CARDB
MNRHPHSLARIVIVIVLLTTLLAATLQAYSMIGNDHALTVRAQNIHDVAVTTVSASRNTAVQGELVYIYVTAENQGDFTETFNVTAYAGALPVSMPQTISNLPSGESRNLTFTWDTESFAEGYHRIKATASAVVGEIDTSDNTFTDGSVYVKFTAEISSSDFYTSTNLPFQQKSFHASGLHWIFYSDHANMVFKTSTNGIVWSSPTVVREALYGYLFSIWFDGTYVHYAYRDVTGILYRRGSISGATITWGPEYAVVTGNMWVPDICVDTSGIPWITYRTNNINAPLDTKPYVVKATTSAGSIWGTPKQLSTQNQLWWIELVPLTQAKVYVLYSYPQGQIYGNLWSGTSWLTTPENVTSVGSVTRSFGSFASVAKGSNVYVVYVHNFTRNIMTLNRTTSGWGTETTLVRFDPDEIIFPEPPDPSPTITVDSSKGDLYVRWIRQKVYQIKYDGNLKEWDTTIAPFGLAFNSPDPRSLTSYYQVWDSIVASTWVEGTEPPFSITYAFQQV